MRLSTFLSIVCLFLGTSMLQAQTYTKTKSGLPYKIIKAGTGKAYPEAGGFITFWFQLLTEKDSIIDNQFQDPNPIAIPTPEVTHKPSIEEGLCLLKDGDSAVFLLNADSLYINSFRSTTPAFIRHGSNVKMIVKMGTMYSKRFVDSANAVYQQQQMQQQLSELQAYTTDSIAIQEYLKKNKLKGIRTAGGTYVVILKASTIAGQPPVRAGEAVKAGYVGKLLSDGTIFDQSQPGAPFTFVVGQGQVIRGWDEGFQKLKKGDKALLLIPSPSAYGSRGAGNAIPPNAPLLFEVEVF